MKKGILFMMSLLLTLLVSLASCSKKTDRNLQHCDSLCIGDVTVLMNDYMNPSFTSVTDAVCEHDRICNMYDRDSIFRSMDKQIVTNVANILIYRSGFCTVQSRVDEYLLHKDIYGNILKRDAVEDRLKRDSTTAPQLPNNHDSSSSSSTTQIKHYELK